MPDPFRACSLKRPLQMQIAIVVTEETETMRRIGMAVAVTEIIFPAAGRLEPALFCNSKSRNTEGNFNQLSEPHSQF